MTNIGIGVGADSGSTKMMRLRLRISGNNKAGIEPVRLYNLVNRPVLWIRIRRDPELFVGSGSGTKSFGSTTLHRP
jgi:hypothetical protein